MWRLMVLVTLGAAAAAWAVAVDVPVEDVTLNLGAYAIFGHYYGFRDVRHESLDYSDFRASADARLYGDVANVVEYNVRGGFTNILVEAYLRVKLPAGFSGTFGRYFVPFGAEATTEEWELTTNYRTATSNRIARSRDDGLRVDWRLVRDVWPYFIGVAGGGYVDNYEGPLIDGVARLYGTPIPGLRQLQIGASYFYGKEERQFYRPYGPDEYHFLEAPRAGADVSYSVWRINLLAEYMQYFVNEILIDYYPGEPVYKDDFYRGYFGALSYGHPLPWRYFQKFEPYARYERYEPAVLQRGDAGEDLYTGGFALYFVGRNLMFRSDYTRILEDANRTSNDEVASAFQLFF